jgi:hypothetical protein
LARRPCVRRRARPPLPPGSRQQVLQNDGFNGCGRPADALSIGDSHRCQFRLFALPDAALDTPVEDHAGRDVMPPADRRRTDSGLFGLYHDRELLGVREPAPVRPSVVRRTSSRAVCQVVSDRLLLSSAACRRKDTAMEARTPVDLQRIRIKSRAPGAHAVDRDVVCCGVIFGTHTTPVQRFDVHCPERLDGLVALVSGHRLSRCLRRWRASSRADSSKFSSLSQRSNVLLFSR